MSQYITIPGLEKHLGEPVEVVSWPRVSESMWIRSPYAGILERNRRGFYVTIYYHKLSPLPEGVETGQMRLPLWVAAGKYLREGDTITMSRRRSYMVKIDE